MKILLIAIDFFGYDIEIKKAFENKGHSVDVIYDYPKFSIVPKRFLSMKMKSKLIKYFQYREFNKIKNYTYDSIITIVGRYLLPEILDLLKKQNKNADFILYMWDDVARVENFDCIKNYFNKIFSFDDIDCKKFGFNFLPLFYSEKYSKIDNNPKQLEYDLASNFTLHSDRIDFLKKIKSEKNKNLYFRFVTNLFVFFIIIVKNRLIKFRKDNIYVTIKSFSQQQNIKFMKKSKAIIDIQHPSQNGLTIRTIECMGLGKKIVTTNMNISKYDFYDKNNCIIVDRLNPKIDWNLLDTDYKPLSNDIYIKYSINTWVDVLLGKKKESYLMDDIKNE